MKKSVAIIVVFLALIAIFWTCFGRTTTTGLVTMMELPSPPPIPSAGAATQTATQPAMQEIAKLPATTIDNRVTNLENEMAAIKNQVEAMNVIVKNAEAITNRPLVEQPMLTETSKINIRSWLALSLAVLAAILVVGVIINLAITRNREKAEEIERIRGYMQRYKQQGYSDTELKSHLESSGWERKKIEEALR
ncbi:hypothetical protein KY329_04050 [Candidatus Woesearchaeota archaeon]|nr:hypothetical protein [Candidatus Woesearchaeota archaeon]